MASEFFPISKYGIIRLEEAAAATEVKVVPFQMKNSIVSEELRH